MSILIYLLLVPFLIALLTIICSRFERTSSSLIPFLGSLIPLGSILGMLLFKGEEMVGLHATYAWIPSLSISFSLKVDAISLVFLILTALIIPICILAVDVTKTVSVALFYALILFLEGLLFGLFMSADLVLFTIFWEAILLPLYFMIVLWGKEKRFEAALRFLIYMIVGSVLMVVAVLVLYLTSLSIGKGTFELEVLKNTASFVPYAEFVFAAFMLAFFVKTPLFPFHAWLPDAYFEASTPATILLSSLLSKAGIYGIIRIGMGLFPALMQQWSLPFLSLAIAGVFYAGFAALQQSDFKRLIAYSSFSHVNFILAGLFVWSEPSQVGATLQAFNHGITIGGLFLVSGWLENRLNTTSMAFGSGLAKYFPKLCWITFIFVLSSIAFPGLNTFIGELMILFGLFKENFWLTALLGASVILSAAYMLRFIQRMYFGPEVQFKESWKDIEKKEVALVIPLLAIIFWMGFYPKPILEYLLPAIENVSAYSPSYLEGVDP